MYCSPVPLSTSYDAGRGIKKFPCQNQNLRFQKRSESICLATALIDRCSTQTASNRCAIPWILQCIMHLEGSYLWSCFAMFRHVSPCFAMCRFDFFSSSPVHCEPLLTSQICVPHEAPCLVHSHSKVLDCAPLFTLLTFVSALILAHVLTYTVCVYLILYT